MLVDVGGDARAPGKCPALCRVESPGALCAIVLNGSGWLEVKRDGLGVF
jgi:hypothetical protein